MASRRSSSATSGNASRSRRSNASGVVHSSSCRQTDAALAAMTTGAPSDGRATMSRSPRLRVGTTRPRARVRSSRCRLHCGTPSHQPHAIAGHVPSTAHRAPGTLVGRGKDRRRPVFDATVCRRRVRLLRDDVARRRRGDARAPLRRPADAAHNPARRAVHRDPRCERRRMVRPRPSTRGSTGASARRPR